MIYILEIPHQLSPKCWSRYSKDGIVSVCHEVASSGDDIYMLLTGQEILDAHCAESLDEFRRECPDMIETADLIERHGLNYTYSRFPHDEQYSAEELDEFDECINWLRSDLSALRVYESRMEALRALTESWEIHQGIKARRALFEEINEHISFEETEDDTQIMVSAEVPEWFNHDSDTDNILATLLVMDGAPEWIINDFDESGILDGVWWVSKTLVQTL